MQKNSHIDSLSVQQARKLVLLSQRLPPVKSAGSAVEATLSAIGHLGYVQIDTISAVQRAHHHTLWNRNPRYKPAHLDHLVVESSLVKIEAFVSALSKELAGFMEFNNCNTFRVHKTTPTAVRSLLKTESNNSGEQIV